jgi:hypothetical protein
MFEGYRRDDAWNAIRIDCEYDMGDEHLRIILRRALRTSDAPECHGQSSGKAPEAVARSLKDRRGVTPNAMRIDKNPTRGVSNPGPGSVPVF